MKKILTFFLILCVAGCAAGPRPVDPGTAAYEIAQQNVNELFSSYSNGAMRSSFGTKIDDNFSPDKEVFLDTAELTYSRQGIVEMNAFVDSVQAKPGVMNVKIRWEMKYNSSSGLQLDRGAARLTFRDRQGTWQLLKITGDNPFN